LECRKKLRNKYLSETKLPASGNYTLKERDKYVAMIADEKFFCKRCRKTKEGNLYPVYVNARKLKNGKIIKDFVRNRICKKCLTKQNCDIRRSNIRKRDEAERLELIGKLNELSGVKAKRVAIKIVENCNSHHRRTFLKEFHRALKQL
jgi:hypothetical protein